jgi:hypothetical protein
MELMLIVWLVSVLSGIKAFVSTYILYILTVLLAVFVCVKINRKFVFAGYDKRQVWGGGVLTLNQPCMIGKQLVPKDTTIELNAYSQYGYVTCGAFGLSSERVERATLEPAIVYVIPPETTEVVVPMLAGVIPKRITWVCYMLIGLQVLLPSDNTIKYMAGAYLIQSTYDSEFVQTALPLGQKAVLNQLERWSKDSEELKDLLIKEK